MASAAYVARPRAAGAPSHCANSRQGPQMWVAPLGRGSRMRCPSLCVALQMLLATARLSASLGPDQIRTEECSPRRSLQPPCNAGACTQMNAHARTHTHTGVHKVPFGTISKRDHQKEKDEMRRIASLPGLRREYLEGSIKSEGLTLHARRQGYFTVPPCSFSTYF